MWSLVDKIPYREGDDPPEEHILAQDEEGNRFWVRPEELKPGHLRHADLPVDLLKIVRWQWRHIGKLLPYGSFEEWELGFLRDQHPEFEIAHWTRLTYALREFTHRNPGVPPASIYQALMAMGAGRADLVKPIGVRRKLERLCRKPDPRLADPDNFTEDGRLLGGQHLE